MIFEPTSKKKGFTLVEMLVYIAILVSVATGAITFLISLDDLIDNYTVETALYRSGANVMEHVLVGLREANQLDSVNTVSLNSLTGALSLNNDGVNTRFVKVGDELQLTKAGVSQVNMLEGDVIVTGFTIYEYDTGAGTLIRVHLELTGTVESITKDINLYGGAIIRGAL